MESTLRVALSALAKDLLPGIFEQTKQRPTGRPSLQLQPGCKVWYIGDAQGAIHHQLQPTGRWSLNFQFGRLASSNNDHLTIRERDAKWTVFGSYPEPQRVADTHRDSQPAPLVTAFIRS